ncbi:MAG: hypothetical protein E2O36_03715 [Proteobacteria bacterium]|nr:MAG: hypothetical protein E2O36_03715 [Pseudomonadota bacterium]
MKAKLIVATLSITVLATCSMLPGKGGSGAKRMVEEEEITTEKVYISQQRIQCEDESGAELTATKADLTVEGIDVFSSSCGVIIGKMAPALCGKITLHINIHEIDQRKIPQAEKLGYHPVDGLENGLGYEAGDCD